MKIYEKPMALVNKFEVEDVIASSEMAKMADDDELKTINEQLGTEATQGVVFQW